jgi:deazaflavin-dependent oxidoreductase (nitroreductase family)
MIGSHVRRLERPLVRGTHLAIGLLGTSRPFTALHRGLYRRLDGRGILRGALGIDAILLTTTGRRTGAARTVPLFAFRLGPNDVGPRAVEAERADRRRTAGPDPAATASWLVVASNAGRPRTPGWYHDLEADPSVEVQLGDRRWTATARMAGEEEHGRLWPLIVAGYPGYDVYRDRTDRRGPIVVLEPR